MVFNWAVIGSGVIANRVFAEIQKTKRHKAFSVYSRNNTTATAFAKRYGAKKCNSFIDAVKDEKVDGVYICTDNDSHFSYIIEALRQGKSVLCEKPIVINYAQLQEAMALAKEKNLFLGEAMWMRYNPVIAQVRDIVLSNGIGQILSINASFGYAFSLSGFSDRVRNLSSAGGALLDAGVYLLSFCEMIMGYPSSIKCQAKMSRRYKTDTTDEITLNYSDNAVCNLYCSIQHQTVCSARIVGEFGTIDIPVFFKPTSAKVSINGFKQTLRCKRGFIYQFDAVAECMRQRLLMTKDLNWNAMLNVMRMMDGCRMKMGLQYSAKVESAVCPVRKVEMDIPVEEQADSLSAPIATTDLRVENHAQAVPLQRTFEMETELPDHLIISQTGYGATISFADDAKLKESKVASQAEAETDNAVAIEESTDKDGTAIDTATVDTLPVDGADDENTIEAKTGNAVAIEESTDKDSAIIDTAPVDTLPVDGTDDENAIEAKTGNAVAVEDNTAVYGTAIDAAPVDTLPVDGADDENTIEAKTGNAVAIEENSTVDGTAIDTAPVDTLPVDGADDENTIDAKTGNAVAVEDNTQAADTEIAVKTNDFLHVEVVVEEKTSIQENSSVSSVAEIETAKFGDEEAEQAFESETSESKGKKAGEIDFAPYDED